MTNEEAIKAMTKYMPKDNDSVSLVLREAMNMGIKALEQEPCEDAISRSKVLEGKVIHQSCDGVEIMNGYAVPVEYIEQLPPVTPKPKTDVLDKIRAEIEQEIEQEKNARGVFRDEKKAVEAEQCTGSLHAYHNVLAFIDRYKSESEE